MAMVFRLEKDRFIDSRTAESYKSITVSIEAAKHGYGKELYLPQPEGEKYITTGEYVRKIEHLAEKNKISDGKREKLLLEGFRADMVYNLDEGEGNLND